MANQSTEVIKNLMRIMSALRTHGAQHYRVHFTSQTRALFIISKHENLTKGELSELLDIRPSSTSDLVRKLTDKGFITVTADSNDKRVSRLAVTEAGKELLNESTGTDFDSIAQNLTQGLTAEEQEELNQLLTKMLAGLKADNEEDEDFSSPFGPHGLDFHGPHFPPFHRGFFNRFL